MKHITEESAPSTLRSGREPVPIPEGSIGVGAKFDAGKRRWALLPWQAVGLVVDVLNYGADKYGAHSWQKVPNPHERYFSAAQRHLIAWHTGERTDPETGIHHLAHAACNLLFLLSKDKDNV